MTAAGSHAAGAAAVSASPAPVPQKTQDSLAASPPVTGTLTGASSPPVPSLGDAAHAPETASSQFALRGGPIVCRSEGLNVRFLSKGAQAEGEGPDARRLLLVTNQRDLPVSEVDQEMAADLSFQINNQSAETVTLSQIQVLLLGVIPCYEDQIAEPQAPRVAEPIKDLAVQEDAPPRKEYADLRAVFADDDTPSEDLQYQIVETTHPEVATASISPRGKLDVSFAMSQSGVAQIIVAALDPFGLSAKCSFFVEVKPRTPPKPDEVVHSDPAMPPGNVDPFGPPGDESRPEMAVPAGAAAGDDSPFADFKVEETPMFLGRLVFAHVLASGDLIAPCSSGDLLPETKTEVLPPNRAKPFRVRIGCWTGHEVPDSKSTADSLIGLADRRRRLAVNTPVLVEVQHLLAVCVRVNSEDGKSQDLYCDHLYQLTSHLRPAAQGKTNSELQLGTEERLEDATSSVLVSLLKSHEETLAYERAKLCGSIPDGFEASAVSLFCYYGDPASPFRATPSTSLFSERDRRPRSNVIDVLTCLQRENPTLWRLLHGQLLQLAAGEDKRAAKAKALEQELQATRPARSLVRSLVRVETQPAERNPPNPGVPPGSGKTEPADPFGPEAPAVSEREKT